MCADGMEEVMQDIPFTKMVKCTKHIWFLLVFLMKRNALSDPIVLCILNHFIKK
jgi:hypothetical protein